MGRPKIKWDSLTYDDYDFDQLELIIASSVASTVA